MTDSQLIFGIRQNDERVWRHIYRDMRLGFASIIGQQFASAKFSGDDIEDIFQESLIVLMQRVKSGDVVASREGAIFSYLVQTGKLTAYNVLRKRKATTLDVAVTISLYGHNIEADTEQTSEERQREQDEFLDRIFGLLPDECQRLLRQFYWNHKSMDDIASILGMRNADSAKTKKSKCMNKLKDIAAQLIESDEFAEDAVRAMVERAALRALLEDERFYADNNICQAALDTEDNEHKE